MLKTLDTYIFAVEKGTLTRLETAGGRAFVGAPVPLWTVTLRQRDGEKATFDATDFPQKEADLPNDDALLSWTPAFGDGLSCRVEVRVSCAADGLSEWRIAVKELPPDWTLFEVRFPCFDWRLEASDRYSMVIPEDRGNVIKNPLVNLPDSSELWQRRRFRERKYPNCFITMQCLGLCDGDDLLYFAAHDPAPVAKNLYFEPDAAAGLLRMRPAVWTGFRYGEDYASFPWAMALQQGDWFDLGMRYRKFALTASWTQNGPLENSATAPHWFQETPMVLLKHYRGELYDADAFIKVAEYLQVPLLLHYYMWHKPAFDTNYPFLFPANPGFREEMKRLQAAGIRVMPYLNTYSCDSGMDAWGELEPLAVRKNEQLELHAVFWSQDGHKPLAALCPATPLAARLLALLGTRAAEMGVDALYFDEIGCSPTHNCYAENHSHVPGDEAAFVAGHRKILRAIKEEGRTFNPDLICATESCAEAYMDVVDAYLIGNGNSPDEVPLFEAVYHDYTGTYGQYMFCEELDEPRYKDALFAKCARQFIFGARFGWSRIPILAIIEKRPALAQFIRMLAHARLRHASFLATGRMLRPLNLDVPAVKVRWMRAWNDQTGTELPLPAVLNSVWTRDDTSIAVVLVNISEEPQEVEVNLRAHEKYYALPQHGIVRLWEHEDMECRGTLADGHSDCLRVRLKPRTCVVASVGCEKPYGVHGV